MMRTFFNMLRSRQDGVATVEFALWCTSFFLVIMVALDFGAFYLERGKLNEAVGAAAVASFDSADNVNFSALPSYVQGITGDDATSVTLSCNGSEGGCANINRSCACMKTDGSFVASSCGSSCSGPDVTAGSTAGYYLTIEASRGFDPIMVPRAALEGAAMSQQATVRLE